MTKFNVGDKVRILDVYNIVGARFQWKNGDLVEVIKVNQYGNPWLKRFEGDESGIIISKDEYNAIELVNEKPTKKQRIEALESQVEKQAEQIAELQSTIAKLREVLS